jgi:hypothetical protein
MIETGPPPRRRLRRRILIVVAVVLAACCGGAAVTGFALYKWYNDEAGPAQATIKRVSRRPGDRTTGGVRIDLSGPSSSSH